MSNLEFAWPYAALLLLLLLPMFYFRKKSEGHQGLLESPLTQVLIELMHGKYYGGKNGFDLFLFFFWTILVLALMRPQLVGDAIEISRDGRNLMMVLDISESMETRDMTISDQPVDRLVVAKEVMNDFIDKRRGDRIGLVVFGSEVFLHAPLSHDYPTIKQFLADAEIGFAGPKTAIGDALLLAIKKLSEEKEGDRLIVLMTDGQNNMGSLEPIQAAKLAQKQNVKIYTIGLGASRLIVDGFFGPSAINPSVSLDEAEPELREISSMTGGKYFRAKDHRGLLSIYDDIDALEPVKSDPIVLIPKKELFYWPLALLVGLLLLSFLVRWIRHLFSGQKLVFSRR